MDTDNVGYRRIRMRNRIEKMNQNRIRVYECIHLITALNSNTDTDIHIDI